MYKLLALNKPYDVLCQFTDSSGRQTLADYISLKGFYPAGRLDRDSEGLVLLSNDGRLQHIISHPRHKMNKVYWVQVEGQIDESTCERLCHGVMLKDGPAKAMDAHVINTPEIWERVPPIRERKSIPTSWLQMSINEGRNRQVRRMTAAVGFPTLRLIRVAIGNWKLGTMKPGEYCELELDDALIKALQDSRWKRHNKSTRKRRTRSRISQNK